MLTRLEQELKPKAPHISKHQVENDWKLLQRALDEEKARIQRGEGVPAEDAADTQAALKAKEMGLV